MTAQACGTATFEIENPNRKPTVDEAIAQGKILDITHLVEPMGLRCRCVVTADSMKAFPDDMPELLRRLSLMPIMSVLIGRIYENPDREIWAMQNDDAGLRVQANLMVDPARQEKILIVTIERIGG